LAAWGLVGVFFLNGIGFLAGRGGGFLLMQGMPARAGVVTAGCAQVGIVLCRLSVVDDCWVGF